LDYDFFDGFRLFFDGWIDGHDGENQEKKGGSIMSRVNPPN
jgi:hypothetical protein